MFCNITLICFSVACDSEQLDNADLQWFVRWGPRTYTKCEGRQSLDEILFSRVVDRMLRPMIQNGLSTKVRSCPRCFWKRGFYYSNAPAICGSTAALHISSLLLIELVAGVRIWYVIGDFIVEHTSEEQLDSKAGIFVVRNRNGILMVEVVAYFLLAGQINRNVSIVHESIIISVMVSMNYMKKLARRKKRAIMRWFIQNWWPKLKSN